MNFLLLTTVIAVAGIAEVTSQPTESEFYSQVCAVVNYVKSYVYYRQL